MSKYKDESFLKVAQEQEEWYAGLDPTFVEFNTLCSESSKGDPTADSKAIALMADKFKSIEGLYEFFNAQREYEARHLAWLKKSNHEWDIRTRKAIVNVCCILGFCVAFFVAALVVGF